MGTCVLKNDKDPKISAITINNFENLYVVGRGGFGKLWKVQKKKSKEAFALKEMSKARIIAKRSVHSVMNERILLSQIYHKFIVNIISAFQDRENLYLLLELMPGGDLRYHLARQKRFTEEQSKFFAACILIGLEYLHLNNIIHRDIKPENLVFDDAGYLRITDFGVAKAIRTENASDTSGTPGYMAPEVMCRQNHGIAVDYYALGIILYECMFGKRPIPGRNRREIRDQILAKQVQIKMQDLPPGWSIEAADFINRLIQRKAINRLGNRGPEELKKHPWLKDFSWEKLLIKEIPPPFLPGGDGFEARQTLGHWNESDDETVKQNAVLLRRDSVQSLFEGYNLEFHKKPFHMAAKSSDLEISQIPSDITTLNESDLLHTFDK